MITERHANPAANGESAYLLDRALLDMEYACASIREALELIPKGTNDYIEFYGLASHMLMLSGKLERRIADYKGMTLDVTNE